MQSSRYFCLILLTIATFTQAQAQQGPQILTWRGIISHPAEWYGSSDALRIADNVLLYQHENGGWGKNVNRSAVLGKSEKEKVIKETRTVQTTIDNGATITELNFLARVYQATHKEYLKDRVLLGINFLLDAQYEGGGWPQFYPIRKGYYQHITYNDGAMIGAMNVLKDAAHQNEPYTFVDKPRRDRAATAIQKGLEVILQTQITVDGKLTAWCAQHDRATLLPAMARAYELPSISGGESVGIVSYLKAIDEPSPRVILAVKSAVDWFERSKLPGIAVVRKEEPSSPKGYDRVVVEDPDASPLWGRFYEIETNRPIFVGRDSKIKHNLAEIEYERRNGYSYLRDYASTLLAETYPVWAKKWNVE
jgi:PelA/Pel-15E family pectate lyase